MEKLIRKTKASFAVRGPDGIMETEAVLQATKDKYQRLYHTVSSMTVRQKRTLFLVLRKSEELSHDTFLPSYGLHCGEFACFQILSEHCRKEAKEKASSSASDPVCPNTL